FDRIPIEELTDDFRGRLSRRSHYENISYTYKNYRWELDDYTNSLVETFIPTGVEKQYTSNPSSRWSLNDSYVSDVYLDDQDILWIGTYSNGINKANLTANPFEYHHHDPTDLHSIIDNNVRALSEDHQGNFWVGTRDKGISIVGRNGKYRHLRHRPPENSIGHDQIKTLFCDSGGYMWIGTKKGIDRYDPQTEHIRHVPMTNLLDSLHTAVYGITEDRSRNMWIATWKGIYKYEPHTDRILHFDPDKTLSQRHTWVIIQDRKGDLWVGTEGGGVSVLRETGPRELSLIRHFKHDPQAAHTLSDNRVYALYEDRDGMIWVGTGNG